jgi:hypothetical protein
VQNPSNPVSDINAALDVAKLADTGATYAGADTAALTADIAGAGMGLGAIGAAYAVSQLLEASAMKTPNQLAKEISPEVDPAQTIAQATSGMSAADAAQFQSTLAADQAAEAAGGVKPVTQYTGDSNAAADAWFAANFGAGGAGGGGRGGSINQQQV